MELVLSSRKTDRKVHLYLSNWPKPSGMHSSTSLCKCSSFLTLTKIHKIFSPATPLPTYCLFSWLCWAPSSAVNRVAPVAPFPACPREGHPTLPEVQLCTVGLHFFSLDIWNTSSRGQIWPVSSVYTACRKQKGRSLTLLQHRWVAVIFLHD